MSRLRTIARVGLASALFRAAALHADIIPEWTLEVAGGRELSPAVTTNTFGQQVPVKLTFPVSYVPISWSNRQEVLPAGTKLEHHTRWLRVSPTGVIASTVIGQPENDGVTMTVDRQRLVLLRVGDRGKRASDAHQIVLTVAAAAISGKPNPYGAWRISPDGTTGIMVAGDAVQQSAYFVDVGSARIKQRIPHFVYFSFAAHAPLVAGTELDYHGNMPTRGRLLVCTLDGDPVHSGPWVPIGDPLPSQASFSADAKTVLFRRHKQLYATSLATGEERIVRGVEPGKFHFSRDGSFATSVTADRLVLYNLTVPSQPRELWSSPHPGSVFVQDVEIADNGEYVAYHLSILRNPLSYELVVLGPGGTVVGEARGQRGWRAGLEFVGSDWLFEGMEYPDSGFGAPVSDVTQIVTLFRCTKSRRR